MQTLSRHGDRSREIAQPSGAPRSVARSVGSTVARGVAPSNASVAGNVAGGVGSALVDAHVHFYPCYDRDHFLDAALANFRRGARELGLPESTPGCLLLSEARGERWFERLADEAEGIPRGAWAVERGLEPEVLVVRRRAEPLSRLFLFAGRQIAAREGIEVLALATDAHLADGLPLFDTLGWANERGAITVLPWGFGKWSLGRGELVRQALSRLGRDHLFLGDSAARPERSTRPRLFSEAEEKRVHILPGTDPLPFPSHATRAGSYGFVLKGLLDEAAPARSLRRLVAGQLQQPRFYGHREGLFGFLYSQARMQARKGGSGRFR
jgi:hypothetical protein